MSNNKDALAFPHRKKGAVVVSFDDLHPASRVNGYEAGGDLRDGVLGLLAELLDKHPQLKITLFVTADWRERYPFPRGFRRWLLYFPPLRDRFYLAPLWPPGTMRLDRHPEFISFLKTLPRVEFGIHGLWHVSKGERVPEEFRFLSYEECLHRLEKAIKIFEQAGLPWVKGICPPGWEAQPYLLQSLEKLGFEFIASARDLWSPISPGAQCKQRHGLKGLPLLWPSRVPGNQLVHIPSNWSSINTLERAREIIEGGGVLSIKGHMVKKMGRYISEDGLDRLFCNYLHAIFSDLEDRFGGHLWWTTMSELSSWFLHQEIHRERRPTE